MPYPGRRLNVHGLAGLEMLKQNGCHKLLIMLSATIILAGLEAIRIIQQISVYGCTGASMCVVLLEMCVALGRQDV